MTATTLDCAPQPKAQGLNLANGTRAAHAAQTRTYTAYTALINHGDSLPPQLAAVARLCLTYPDHNLTQLAAAAVPPMSKDRLAGLVRRLAGYRPRPTPPPPPRQAGAAGPYGLVDTREPRLWLRRLRRYYTYREIAALAGLADPNTIGDLEAGTRRWTYRRTAAAVLAVPIPPDRMPRWELVPNPSHRRPLRGLKRWREDWDWVKVARAVAGQATREDLSGVEEERAVRQMAAAGMSAGEIGRRLRWCGPDATVKQEEDAISHYMGRNNIPSGRPRGTRRLAGRAGAPAAA